MIGTFIKTQKTGGLFLLLIFFSFNSGFYGAVFLSMNAGWLDRHPGLSDLGTVFLPMFLSYS